MGPGIVTVKIPQGFEPGVYSSAVYWHEPAVPGPKSKQEKKQKINKKNNKSLLVKHTTKITTCFSSSKMFQAGSKVALGGSKKAPFFFLKSCGKSSWTRKFKLPTRSKTVFEPPNSAGESKLLSPNWGLLNYGRHARESEFNHSMDAYPK